MRSDVHGRPGSRFDRTVEWPTVVLAFVIYGSWATLTWFHAVLPIGLLGIGGGWLIAWQSSLQHETIHGHPTASRGLNWLIGAAPLALWLPYDCYRRDHLTHHATDATTDPREDPESHYLLRRSGIGAAIRRVLATLQAPLLGRLILGPPIVIVSFFVEQGVRAWRQPLATFRDWMPHLTGVGIILLWLSHCQLGIGTYLLAFVYPGCALSLLRSFAEHRAAVLPGHRVAIVERAGPFALLYLHNNLHAVHHAAPALPWYRIPSFYRRHRDDVLSANGGLLYRGYSEVFWRYGLKAHDGLLHPVIATASMDT